MDNIMLYSNAGKVALEEDSFREIVVGSVLPQQFSDSLTQQTDHMHVNFFQT